MVFLFIRHDRYRNSISRPDLSVFDVDKDVFHVVPHMDVFCPEQARNIKTLCQGLI